MSVDTVPPTDIRRFGAYKWLVVGMLWLVCFLNYADRQAIFAIFPLLKQQFHLSDVQLGTVAASFMWMYALFGPFAGWLTDHLPRNRLVLGALIFWSLVTAATAFAHSYAQLVLCRAFGGLGEAIYFPAAMSLIGSYHSAATRSRAMSVHQSSVYAGSIAGGALSGFVGQHYGWPSSFLLFGAAGTALGLLVWVLLKEPPRSRSTSLSSSAALIPSSSATAGRSGLIGSIWSVLRNRMVLLLIFVFIGANFVAVVFLTWLPTFLFRKFHMSLSLAGLNGTAFLQAASVLGVLAGGVLADSMVRTTRSGRLSAQALGLLCGVPFLFLTGWATAIPLLALGMVGFGFFKGIYDANIFASLFDVIPESQRGIAVGVLNSMGWLGGGFAPIAIALASTRYGMSTCLSATAGIYLLLGLLLAWGANRMDSTRLCIQ